MSILNGMRQRETSTHRRWSKAYKNWCYKRRNWILCVSARAWVWNEFIRNRMWTSGEILWRAKGKFGSCKVYEVFSVYETVKASPQEICFVETVTSFFGVISANKLFQTKIL